ncbi:hypothetical protein SISNIDRAFT_489605 [Sistotremastrum niveocremeum HHB9708]|uniref:DUF6535 domain-containing protein n=1 Tax=Sistotremastrum niveocremeum HHB9708 TaxID=1314777 RepID=A0A164PQL4_9AGAM|nr:hypothetical protein SISNIDRAFT_489605 [Sistotremastrum niveocremeum HHB9708]
MSTPSKPPDLPSLSSNSPTSSSEAPVSPSAPIIDPFDTPLFNRLIGLIEELSVTVKEQKNALEEQNDISMKQREVLEEQTNVMKDMRRALEYHGISTVREISEDEKLDLDDDRSSTKAESRNPTSTSPTLPSPSTHQMSEPADADHTVTITPSPDIDALLINRSERSREQIGADIVNGTTAEEGIETAAGPSTNPIHDTLLLLSKTMETMKETLIEHGRKFDILTRDAIKDDQPYELKAPDESTCTALFEMAMTKTKEEVDEWIKRMDVSLVFILNAVLSVLGRQWMSKLTAKPVGNTYRERLLRHIAREALAKRWLGYLVEGLHILLLWSIGLFM